MLINPSVVRDESVEESNAIMLKAVIFDFDGVIADAEPVHLKAFQDVLREEGIGLSKEEYYEKYLALDDKTFFKTVLGHRGVRANKKRIEILMTRKSEYFDKLMKEEIHILPGVYTFVKNAESRYALAIGSGALRREIEFILSNAGMRNMFPVITSADEVTNCKPDPEVFIKALQQINASLSRKEKIKPSECLVIEDSVAGVKAAHAAAMKCLAVTNSYGAEKLSEADMIVNSLEEVQIADLEKLFVKART